MIILRMTIIEFLGNFLSLNLSHKSVPAGPQSIPVAVEQTGLVAQRSQGLETHALVHKDHVTLIKTIICFA